MTKLIVGLGNPGINYASTRHNIGQMVVEHILPGSVFKNKLKGVFSQMTYQGENIYLLIPQTYMNLSGECIAPFAHFFKITPQDMLIVHDELDLPFGDLALKRGGGLAGHNGLKSLKAHINTEDFFRLRIGISRPVHGDVSSYVLSPFSENERSHFATLMDRAIELCHLWITNKMLPGQNQLKVSLFKE